MRMRTTLAATVTALAIAASGCGGDDTETEADSGAAAPQATGGAAVSIKTFMYEPSPLEVEAGTTVTFTNEDDILHTVTSGTQAKPTKDFDEDLDGAGTTAEVTFDEPGTIDYFCAVHDGMDGQVVVN